MVKIMKRKIISSTLSIVLSLSVVIQTFAGIWNFNGLNWINIESNGVINKGWYSEGVDDWYYMDDNGIMQTGWYGKYHLHEISDGMLGHMDYGWYFDGKNWYFLNTTHNGEFGAYQTGWQWIDGYCYYFDEQGKLLINTITTDGYQVNSEGRWIVGGVEQYKAGYGMKSVHTHLKEGNKGAIRGGSSGGGGSSGNNDYLKNQLVKTKENVKAFDSTTEDGLDELKSVYEGIYDYWTDDKGTEDWEDDEFNFVVNKDNPLLTYILNGTYQPNDVIFIPACEYFPTGVSLVYQYHDDEYASNMNYAHQDYEVIHTKRATLENLIDDEIDFSSTELDDENPISFIWTPEYITDTMEIESEEVETISSYYNSMQQSSEYFLSAFNKADIIEMNNEIVMYAEESSLGAKAVEENARWGTPNSVKGKGLQLHNLTTAFIPTVDITNTNKGEIGLKINDLVLVDLDGKCSTKYDRLVLSGEMALKNIKPTVDVDWNPKLTDPLPKQFIAKLSYNEENNIKATIGGEIGNLKEVYKAMKKSVGALTHNNKRSIFGMDIEGVDMEDSIILGAVGINVAAKTVKLNIKSLRDQSIKLPFAPTFIVLLTLDFSGNIKATVVGEYEYSSYIEKGINVQKDGYVGRHGTCAQNMGQKNYKIGNRNVNIYDLKAKSLSEKDKEPLSTICISGKGEAKFNAGLGAGLGVMMAGIIPAMFKGKIVALEADTKMDGKLTKSSDTGFNLEGEASINAALVSDIKALVKLTAKTIFGNPGIKGEWELGKITWMQLNLTSAKVKGQVLAADADRDDTNNPRIADAAIEIKQKATWSGTSNRRTTVTDADGYFEVQGLADGKYSIKITKENYKTYEGDLEVNSNLKEFKIFLDSSTILSEISGQVYEADDDADNSNNMPLSEVKVKISKISSSTTEPKTITTEENGTYKFSELPLGLYEITFEKDGYISLKDEIKVTSSSVYNAAMEIISNDYAGQGEASGSIINAINGESVGKGIHLKVTKGYMVTDADVVATTETDSDGKYQLSLSAGIYTVWLTDNSEPQVYADDEFVIKVLGNKTIDNQNGEMIPLLDVEEVRIVLTWGSSPEDLDSHLSGPCTEDERFHIYFENMNYEDEANLDIDDVTSFGPETITITKQRKGIYRYSVHDYTNRESSSSMSLANSGAYVRVYLKNDSDVQTFSVPYSEGTVWNVFDYDSTTGQIIPVNTMEYQSNEWMVSQLGEKTMPVIRMNLLKSYELESATPSNASRKESKDETESENTKNNISDVNSKDRIATSNNASRKLSKDEIEDINMKEDISSIKMINEEAKAVIQYKKNPKISSNSLTRKNKMIRFYDRTSITKKNSIWG